MGDVLQVGPLRLRFESTDRAVEQRMYRLFGGFGAADGDDDAQLVTVEPEVRKDDQGWLATIDGQRVRWARRLAAVEESLTRKINRLVLDAEDDRLHLHAGAVACDDEVVLVVGPSGSGKSTLVAALVAAGWRLLSDEQLGVLEGGRLVPFPRPVTLRRNSWPLFEGLGIEDQEVDRVEVPIEDLGAAWHGDARAPDLVVVPDVSVDAHRIARLSTAEVVAALVNDTLDLERAGRAGIEAIVAIACVAQGVRISGTDLDETRAAINRLVAEPKAPTPPVEEERAGGDGDVRTPATHAWRFADGSAALYDSDGGALAILDEAGFDAWRALGSPRREWPPEMASSPFVEQLTEAGLLSGAVEADAP